MDYLKDFWHKIKNSAINIWRDFENWAYANQRRAVTVLATVLIVVTLVSASFAVIQTRIRHSQESSLVFAQVTNSKIKPLNYGEGDNEITETNAISVMFAPPHGTEYNKVMKLLDQKKDELNRPFYYYPAIYDTADLAKKYQIDPNKVTFIFFEKGEEKNRFTLDSFDDLEEEFIPELNRLPMWNIKEAD